VFDVFPNFLCDKKGTGTTTQAVPDTWQKAAVRQKRRLPLRVDFVAKVGHNGLELLLSLSLQAAP
jgi:hypothetical protein